MTWNTSPKILVRGLPMQRGQGLLSGKWIALTAAFLLWCPTVITGWIQGGGSALAAASQQRRVALVVGNNAYPQMPLENAVNDARVMEQTLGQFGFEVRKIENSSLIELAKAVDAFIGQLGSGDVGLFFYAGHSIQIEGENYLVPIDFEATDETVAKYKSYAAEVVRERMEKAGARLNIIVLDACRNNPFRMSRSASRGLAAMNSGRGTLIAFATGPGKTASDNLVGKNGLFTHHLVECLKIPGLSLDEVFNRTRAEVDKASSHEQTPWVVSSVIGDFSFQPEGAPPTVPAVATPPPGSASRLDYSDLERIAANRRQSAARTKEMKTAHDKARFLEDAETLTAAEKAQAWQRFLDSYQADDPQDNEDNRLRELAISRLRYWQEVPAAPRDDSPAKPAEKPLRPLASPRPLAAGSRRAPASQVQVKTRQGPLTGMEFVWVPGGCYAMGCENNSNDCDKDEHPSHEVCVDGFWMASKEVTVGQFRRFVEATGHRTDAEKNGWSWVYSFTARNWENKPGINWRNPGFPQDDRHPVVHVSWHDAQAMLRWLGEKSKGQYQLPTEAQWEWACRAGSRSARFWGNQPDDTCRYANVADRSAQERIPAIKAHGCSDGFPFTAPAASFAANGYGLYDMLGNVWEWCQDVYNPSGYSQHQKNNPVYSGSGSGRVFRGASWSSEPKDIRCANRFYSAPEGAYYNLGFRLVAIQ
jgi:formylglycine-generating enzyme